MYSEAGKRLINEAHLICIACAALCLCTAGLRYVIIPGLEHINEKRLHIKYLEGYLKSGKGSELLKDTIHSKNEQLQKKLDKMTSTTQVGSISEMLELLIAKASAADIRFVRMQPQLETQQGPQPGYPVILEMNTTYHSLGRFIASLEALPHIVKVSRLGIESQPEGRIRVHLLVKCHLPQKEQP